VDCFEPPIIAVDHCTGCGACVAICPDQVLELGDTGAARWHGEQCLLCGHCAAICPEQAVNVPSLADSLGLESGVEPVGRDGGAAAFAELVVLMRQRRSCRRFTGEPVATGVLRDLTRIGSTAPSGTNCQAWRFTILPDRCDVERLGEVTADFYRRLNKTAANRWYRLLNRLFGSGSLDTYYRRYYQSVEEALRQWYEQRIDRLFHGAPAAILVSADKRSSCPAEDALLATQNMLLAAQALGLGTCLVGFVVEAARRDHRIGRLLRMPADERLYAVIACGHPAVHFLRPAGRKRVAPRILRIGEEEKWKQGAE
jgi:nitroreductase/NAD-dependent dihydropyrimidine dehydrogenase PreA subunit